MEKIVFVGAGSMAEAIIAGIVTHKVVMPERIFVMNKADDDRLQNLQQKYGLSIVCKERRALGEADLIVLATKPKDIRQAMQDISNYVGPTAAALSVIAGVPITAIEDGLGMRPVARCMPNTSAAIGKSASAVAMNETVTDSLREEILHLLGAIGIVKEVKEDDLHAVTALSGSGPAYIYYLAEALEAAAINNGLHKETARELIVQTIEGAAFMLRATGTEPDELRRNVTSPGGTTEAGLNVLERRLFKEAIAECLSAAAARSRELGTKS